jgi:hypothetical protein
MVAVEIDECEIPEKPHVYVYIHRRPDGEAFYIGKGMGRRAWDFSPRRRTAHHRHIMEKYGRENITVQIIPCMSEAEAHALERVHIAIARARGDRLCNLTDGGEGVAGREMSEAQKAALAKGRGRHVEDRKLSAEALAAIDAARARGRKNRKAWQESDAGRAHMAALGAAGKARLHAERVNVCLECRQEYVTRSAMGKCCSRLCEQRHRRARDKAGK